MFGMCNKEHKRCLFIVSKIDIIWSNRRTHVFINCLKHLLRLPETHNALQLPVFFFSLSASSPSPHDFASVIRNIGKFGAKTILQTSEQLIQFAVLEIHFQSLKYMTVIRIRKKLSNIPFQSKRWPQGENSVDVNNAL